MEFILITILFGLLFTPVLVWTLLRDNSNSRPKDPNVS